MHTNAPGTRPPADGRRGWLASRLYDWLDARRWYWSLGDQVTPALRDWPVARPPSRRPRG
jgi:hypothetical protein